MRLQGGMNPQKTQNAAQLFGVSKGSEMRPNEILQKKTNKLQVSLSPQQIRAIKNAPKGVLPAFLNKANAAGGSLGKVVKKGYRGAAKAQGEK